MSDAHRDFVPALGKSGSLDRYDAAIALMTREKRWRSDLLRFAEPRPGERIVDIGCGTGTFAIALKQAAPESIVLAVDPDPAVLEIARAKAEVADAEFDGSRLWATSWTASTHSGNATRSYRAWSFTSARWPLRKRLPRRCSGS